MNDQWIRKAQLIVLSKQDGLDLSQFRITFHITNADVESPNSAAIRIYNLSPTTQQALLARGAEFAEVILNAGYENGNFGTVFKGTIKQFKIGRENATDTYFDLLAADGDIGYNQGIVNTALAKGVTTADAIKTAVAAMPSTSVDESAVSRIITTPQNVPSLRGQVLFGMARARLRNLVTTLDSTWSIQDGKVVVIQRTGYLPGEAVKINTGTGMIGVPQQTDQGIRIKCLLNSRLKIGSLVQLNNSEITKLVQADPKAAPIPYNQWSGFQFNAPLSKDGTYRAYVVEHEGDTRGHAWYSNLVCLAVDTSSPIDDSVGAP